MSSNLLSRITLKSEVCQGKTTIRNQRLTVEFILDLLSSGMNEDEIIQDYPSLAKEGVLACLEYASNLVKVKSIYKASA